jgi:hypothetical protein
MVLKFDFRGKSLWVMANKQFYKEKDDYNCRPIACLKIMEMYGWLKTGPIHQIGTRPRGYCSAVMEFYFALLTTYDGDLQVQLRTKV